jgi:hypothetical protein
VRWPRVRRLGLLRFPLVLQGLPEAEVCLIHIPTEKEQGDDVLDGIPVAKEEAAHFSEYLANHDLAPGQEHGKQRAEQPFARGELL